MEGTGFTLRKGNVDVLSLADSVEVEGSGVAAAVALEGAHGLGKCGVTVRVGAQVLNVGKLRAVGGVLAADRCQAGPCCWI